jgi:hypothetical protein
MGDLLFVVVVAAFFALMVGLVMLCDRIIGRDEDSDLAVFADEPEHAEEAAA